MLVVSNVFGNSHLRLPLHPPPNPVLCRAEQPGELPASQSPTHIPAHTLSGSRSPSRDLPNFWGSEEPSGDAVEGFTSGG